MTEELFKQIRKEIQGKYFVGQFHGNAKYRRVVKVRIPDRHTCWFTVCYNYISNFNGENTDHDWSFKTLKDFYRVFGKRITPSKYKLKLESWKENLEK